MTTEKTLTGYPSIDKPWLKYYSEEAINTSLPEYSMYEYIYNQNQDNLDRVALNYYGADTTYGQMFLQIDRMAGTLEAEGVKEGEAVTVCMINAPDAVCLLFALNKIGAVANMVCGADSPEDLKKHITDAKSSLVFTLDMFQEKFVQIADDAKLKKVVVTNITESMSPLNRFGARVLKGMKPLLLPNDSRFCSWKSFFKNAHQSTRTCHDANAPAVITYTGGTTGGSKGAVLSSKAANSVAQQYILSEGNLEPGDVWIQVLPLFIAFGITCSLILSLSAGMQCVIRTTEPIAVLCKKFNPNFILHGPAYWEKLADDNEQLDLSAFKAILTGGDILRASAETKINEYLKRCGSPVPIMNGYAMTEIAAGGTLNYPRIYKKDSVGIPLLKVTISAFDPDNGKELKYGEEGELCIQTPAMMLKYVNNEEETNKIIQRHDDGSLWVHSGDLGYVDEDGFIFVSGRMKRFFAYVENGVHKKVFSYDIEKVLLQHPKVENCAVVPIPDEKTLQVPIAYVILKNEYVATPDLESELITYGKMKLVNSHRPVKYIFVGKFPLTKIGKIDYRTLEKEAGNSV